MFGCNVLSFKTRESMSRQVVDLTIHTPNTNKEMLTYSNWHLIRERNSNERSAAIKLLITTVFELSGMV